MENYSWTSVCIEANPDKYHHSDIFYEFGSEDQTSMPQAFFRFTLEQEIDSAEAVFAISCQQQGDRLKNYRLKDASKVFKPSDFNVMLMKADGEYVGAKNGRRFMFSLLNDDTVLQPGEYIFMVDPIWNASADLHEDFKKVMISIYAPEQIEILPISDRDGLRYLVQGLKNAALSKVPEEKQEKYLAESKPDYADVIRVSDIDSLSFWYGFIYTQNNSQYRLKESITPKLEGMEALWPQNMNDEGGFALDIPAGEDHIIILRQTEGSCSYGLSYLTYDRELTDDELIEKAKAELEKTVFGDSEAYFKLYNAIDAACFHFENPTGETLVANFALDLTNLAIFGNEEAEDKNKFEVRIPAGESSHQILKKIKDGEGTAIQMTYSH